MPTPFDPSDRWETHRAFQEDYPYPWEESDACEHSTGMSGWPEEGDLGVDPGSLWHAWVTGDGSCVVRIGPDPLYLRILPWDHPVTPLAWAFAREWVDPHTVDRAAWEWEGRLDDFDLLAIARERPRHPLARLVEAIPPRIVRNLAPYGSLQMEMLRLAARFREARQLAQRHPTLLWLLVDSMRRNPHQAISPKDLLRRRQAEILAWVLGRPPTRQRLRLLKKYRIPAGERVGEEELRALRALLASSLAASFRHWPALTPEVVALGLRRRACWRRCLLTWLGDAPVESWSERLQEFTSLWHDVLQQCRYDPSRRIVLESVKTARQLEALHRKWTETDRILSELSVLGRDLDEPFPPSALDAFSGPHFRRLGTPRALFRESVDMDHCVGLHVDRARSGRHLYFSVTFSPEERLTLHLVRREGRWQLKELKGYRNREPSDRETTRVVRWLMRSRRLTGDRP